MKLHYIFLDRLTTQEEDMIKQNIKKQSGEDTLQMHIYCLRGSEEDKKTLEKADPQQSLMISQDRHFLEQMSKAGMAALLYVQEKDDLQKEDADLTMQEESTWAADIVVEGFEEVDALFLLRSYERRHGIPWTILETKRLVVRELALEDVKDLFRLYENGGITEYVEPLYEYEKELEYQRSYIEYMYRFYGFGMWLVFEKETGNLIGRAGVECREELEGELELGYAFDERYRHRGYATEACLGILDFVKEYLQADAINCLMECGNSKSEQLALRLGFRFEKELKLNEKRMKKYSKVL